MACSLLKKIDEPQDESLALVFFSALEYAYPTRFPEGVSLVCRRWRDVALDSAGLRSRIDFVLREGPRGQSQGSLSETRQRARTIETSVAGHSDHKLHRIEGRYSGPGGRVDCIPLKPHAHR